jgi:hypothetical protein
MEMEEKEAALVGGAVPPAHCKCCHNTYNGSMGVEDGADSLVLGPSGCDRSEDQ